MKNLLLMLGFLISLTCSSQNITYMVPVNTYNYLNSQTTPKVFSSPEDTTTLKNKFTQIRIDNFIYVTIEYYMVEGGLIYKPITINVVLDVIKEEAYIKINNKEVRAYSLSACWPKSCKIGYDKSSIKQSMDKTYVRLTVQDDILGVTNDFKILFLI